MRHVRSEENTNDVNSKNTKIETHTKMADRLYEGLVIAEVSEQVQAVFDSSKEDVGSARDSVVTRDQYVDESSKDNSILDGARIGTSEQVVDTGCIDTSERETDERSITCEEIDGTEEVGGVV